jgi:hypothetical protein
MFVVRHMLSLYPSVRVKLSRIQPNSLFPQHFYAFLTTVWSMKYRYIWFISVYHLIMTICGRNMQCVRRNRKQSCWHKFMWRLILRLRVKTNRMQPSNRTHSLMELSPSWEAANCAATQELPNSLWNPKVYYSVQKSPKLAPILSQIDPIHTIPSYIWSILILYTRLCLGLSSGSFLLAFPPISYMHSSSSSFVLHAPLISSSLTWSL